MSAEVNLALAYLSEIRLARYFVRKNPRDSQEKKSRTKEKKCQALARPRSFAE